MAHSQHSRFSQLKRRLRLQRLRQKKKQTAKELVRTVAKSYLPHAKTR